MKYRGFTSLYSYCAHRSQQKGGKCPSIRFAFDNVIAPNASDKSRKRQYANDIQMSSRIAIGRVTVCPKR
jgi:hypothetical protein